MRSWAHRERGGAAVRGEDVSEAGRGASQSACTAAPGPSGRHIEPGTVHDRARLGDAPGDAAPKGPLRTDASSGRTPSLARPSQELHAAPPEAGARCPARTGAASKRRPPRTWAGGASGRHHDKHLRRLPPWAGTASRLSPRSRPIGASPRPEMGAARESASGRAPDPGPRFAGRRHGKERTLRGKAAAIAASGGAPAQAPPLAGPWQDGGPRCRPRAETWGRGRSGQNGVFRPHLGGCPGCPLEGAAGMIVQVGGEEWL